MPDAADTALCPPDPDSPHGHLQLDLGNQRLDLVHAPGPVDRPSLILLHEALGSVSQWRDWPQRLAQATGCAVVAYARAGHGWSSPGPDRRAVDYLHHEALDVLPRLLAALHITRPILIGHSDGGSIALLNAALSPTPPLGAVVLAPHHLLEPETVAGLRAARPKGEDLRFLARLARHHRDPKGIFDAWNDTWLRPDFADFSFTAELARITVPVLALQGENDQFGSAAQITDIPRLAQGAAEAILIPDCGHDPFRDAPDVVLDHIRRFVADLIAAEGLGQSVPA